MVEVGVPGVGTDDLVDDGDAAVLVAVEYLLGRNVTVDVVAILEIEKSVIDSNVKNSEHLIFLTLNVKV